ncbi:MAG: hypothetical protein JRN06_02850 [Nitrososphaerota archaeon]|nr:hypothetical protein [Nitrososphaerota archaeon]MDG7023204.1 hypothetical protein [Nitrososphaerota archaeon]
MSTKSLKLWWNPESVGKGNVLNFLFGDRDETIKVAKLTVNRMKQVSTLSMTKRELRFFAKDLETGKLGVKYSYHGFYTKLIRKLLYLGLMEKDVAIWDPKHRKTPRVYQLKLQPISERPPQSGFVKQTWQIAKAWNDLIQESA